MTRRTPRSGKKSGNTDDANPEIGKTTADFTENAIRDARLVTGRNPASAKKSAGLLVQAVSESKAQ